MRGMKERKTRKRVDFFDGTLVALTAGILFTFGTAFLLFPQESFSERENRTLLTWEAPTWQSVSDGSFSETLGSIYRDQFPLRRTWIATKAYGEIFLGKRENNGILWGEDGYLMARKEYADLSVAKENLRSVAQCSKVTAVWIPRSSDVMSHMLPSAYPTDTASELFDLLDGQGIFPLEVLRDAATEGSELYYRTDHHLTTEGAYRVYCLLGEALGYAPLAREAFARQIVSDRFRGSADSAIGGIAPQADRIELFRYQGDESVRVIDRTTGAERYGFYDWSALEKKDQYSVFLGGNFAHLSVEDGKNEKPRLLLVKDSFANALIPFLAIHFDLEIVDLRYASSEVRAKNYERTLILQGIDTLATDPSLRKLSLLQRKG